jgi:hypothetical protein
MLGLLCKSACHGTNTRSKCANLGPSASDLEDPRIQTKIEAFLTYIRSISHNVNQSLSLS